MRIILNGASGRMGRAIIANRDTSDRFVALVDKNGGDYADIFDFSGDADVIIDFSSPSATESVLEYATVRNIPAVIATTGHTAAQIKAIKRAGKNVPVFHSANCSLGIAVLISCVKSAAKALPFADVEIIERHHADKVDSPSGTAIAIAKSIPEKKMVYGRKGKRKSGETGVCSVRGGNIFGEHEVLLCFGDEVLSIKHSALSRDVFAVGALRAARFLINKRSGVYDMFSLINET